jgi:hypothetical protein
MGLVFWIILIVAVIVDIYRVGFVGERAVISRSAWSGDIRVGEVDG